MTSPSVCIDSATEPEVEGDKLDNKQIGDKRTGEGQHPEASRHGMWN